MNRKHYILNSSQQMLADNERNKMLNNLTFERQALDNNENIVKQKMRHSLQISKNKRIYDLKKTL